MPVISEAPWRRRFRATQMSMPEWARDAPHRLLFISNRTGRFELHTRDLATGVQRQVTDRPEGTTPGRLDPSGETIWWFEDRGGDELGTWRAVPFGGGPPRPAAPGGEPAHEAGPAIGPGFPLVGPSHSARSPIWLRSPALV